MEIQEEEWNICLSHWDKNFKCKLINSGKWRLEENLTFGKWLFLMDRLNNKTCPTFVDQRNFLSGLLEVEKRNDKFRRENGSKPQKFETLRKFRNCLNEIEESWREDEQTKII